jgi:hypothetical protein
MADRAPESHGAQSRTFASAANMFRTDRRGQLTPLIPRTGLSSRDLHAAMIADNSAGNTRMIPKLRGTLGQPKRFLTYVTKTLITHLTAHHQSIAAWQLYTPKERVLGVNVSIPEDIAPLCTPDKIESTLGTRPSGPVRQIGDQEHSPTPTSQTELAERLRIAQWDGLDVETAYTQLKLQAMREEPGEPAATHDERTRANFKKLCDDWIGHVQAKAFTQGAAAERLKYGEATATEDALRLWAVEFLEKWLAPAPMPTKPEQKAKHQIADQKFMGILNTAFEDLLGTYPHLFDHESGQETLTRLYEIFIPCAANFRDDFRVLWSFRKRP